MDASTDSAPGLRERKAASTRVAIVESLRRRLQTTALSEISVEELAADANVSRMTFFNYFPTKEHALELLTIVWIFELSSLIARARLRGVAAIVAIFDATGEVMDESPFAMRRMMGYFGSRAAERPLPELGRVERAMISPDVADHAFDPSLGAMLMRFVDQARRDGELELEGTTYELAHYLGSLMNGAIFVGRSSPETDWKRLFRRHVRRALGLPLTGKAASAPATPARYRKQKGGR